MNRSELAAVVSTVAEITKSQADLILKATLDAITLTIKQNGKMVINGLGTFTATQRAERAGINPATRQKMVIPATVVPGFKASSSLKALLNNEKI